MVHSKILDVQHISQGRPELRQLGGFSGVGAQKKRPRRWSKSGVPCGCMQATANRLYEPFLLC